MSSETSDEQLMLAFKSGDARAFRVLVHRHRGPVFNFILRYAGQKARAEDLLQETWLKVVNSSHQYEPKARFTTWVYTIARHVCVDSARRETYRQTESFEAHVDEHGRNLADKLKDTAQSGPERSAYNARLRPMLTQVLAELPEEQREVFLLREYHGISFKEIAQITEVNENTVKSRMRYALEGLRKRLVALGVDGDLVPDGRTVA